MMKHILLTTIFNLIFTLSLSAQHDIFSVMISKGNNSYGIPGNLKPVLIGSGMHNDQLLYIADNGYVSLVHEQTGASIELTASGNYSVIELEQLVSKQSVSLLAKYARFLLGKLSPGDTGSYKMKTAEAAQPNLPVTQVPLPDPD